MRTCGFYDEDGDDHGLGRPPCNRDPWRCTYFRKRFKCPWMDKWDERKYQEWKVWKHNQISIRDFRFNLRYYFWICILIIMIVVILSIIYFILFNTITL